MVLNSCHSLDFCILFIFLVFFGQFVLKLYIVICIVVSSKCPQVYDVCHIAQPYVLAMIISP